MESENDCSQEWEIMQTNVLSWIGEEKINEYRIESVLGKGSVSVWSSSSPSCSLIVVVVHFLSGSFGVVKKCQREVNDPPYREFALKVKFFALHHIISNF